MFLQHFFVRIAFRSSNKEPRLHMRAGFSLYLIFCIRWRIIKDDGAEFNILSQLANEMG